MALRSDQVADKRGQHLDGNSDGEAGDDFSRGKPVKARHHHRAEHRAAHQAAVAAHKAEHKAEKAAHHAEKAAHKAEHKAA